GSRSLRICTASREPSDDQSAAVSTQDSRNSSSFVSSPSVIRDAGTGQGAHRVFAAQQRPGSGLELREFFDNGLALRRVAPDADALICGGLPGVFGDDDPAPTDLPFKTRGCHRVVGQLFIVGVLTDGQ